VTVSPANVGVVKVNGVNYTPNCGYNTNQDLTMEAVATNSLYKFNSWGGALSGSTNPTKLIMNTDKTVSATFVLKTQAVDLQGAKTLLDGSRDVLVLDVSDAAQFAASHILCAKNYAWNSSSQTFTPSAGGLSAYKAMDVLVYDQTGAKSASAASSLAGQGFSSVKYMTDGLDDWMAEGYATFTTAEDADGCTSLGPKAFAGADQTVNENQTVTLNGSGSSSGMTYAWEQKEGASVTFDSSGANPTFTAPDLNGPAATDTLVFHLTVTDAGGNKDTDSVSVTVLWKNLAPTANAGADQTVNYGDTVQLNGTGSTDPENNALNYQWTASGGTIDPLLSGSDTATPSFTAPNKAGWVQYELTVTDNGGLQSKPADAVIITVKGDVQPQNQPPVANAGTDQTMVEKTSITLHGSGTDSDGTIASYKWAQTGGIAGVISDSNTAAPTFTAPSVTGAQQVTLTLTVTDDDGASDTDTVVINITDIPADTDGDGYTPAQGDCNDNDKAIYPGASEICGDGKDNNCNGSTDEGCAPWNRDYKVQIQSKLSVSKWGKASNSANGMLSLNNGGAFLLDEYGTPHDMSGLFAPDAKEKKLVYSLNAAGRSALEDHLIALLESAAAAQGLDLSNLDYSFLKVKISTMKIDKKTQRAAGKMTFTISGTVSGCVAGGECEEKKFTYKAKILLQ